VRRKNPFRQLVPLAGSARQKALPHARRCAGIRCAKGKPETIRSSTWQSNAAAAPSSTGAPVTIDIHLPSAKRSSAPSFDVENRRAI
jgi:hypothetical protein